MVQLSNITMGDIDSLVDNAYSLGTGKIKASKWRFEIKFSLPGETIFLKIPADVYDSTGGFLGFVDKALADRGLYLANAEYKAETLKGFFPS